jgi:transcriptional regulator with XRE-family HTH domain
MAREKTAAAEEHARTLLAERLKEIRVELYGADGGAEVARLLRVPIPTWYNYERGVTVPAEVILVFIAITTVSPKWLLFGVGEKYRAQAFRTLGEQAAGEGVRLADLFKQVSELLEERNQVFNVSWKKSK